MTDNDMAHMKKLLKCVRKDLEAYLDDPLAFRSEYFEGVLDAVLEMEKLTEKGDTNG